MIWRVEILKNNLLRTFLLNLVLIRQQDKLYKHLLGVRVHLMGTLVAKIYFTKRQNFGGNLREALVGVQQRHRQSMNDRTSLLKQLSVL